MDLGRGNLVFPQFWGDTYLLNDKDIEFLKEVSALVKRNESLFLRRRNILGDPWKNEVYGYANVGEDRGFLFLNNVHFEARQARLNLGELGLTVTKGTRLEIVSHFPEKRRLVKPDGSEYEAGDTTDLWLRPFETLMLEVSRATSDAGTLSRRNSSSEQARRFGGSLALDAWPIAEWMELRFGEAAQYEKRGFKQKRQAWAAIVPKLDSGQHILAITVALRKGGIEWRYSHAVVEIVQVVAQLGGHELKLIAVPDSRQFGNTQGMGCSWVVYKARLNPESAGKVLEFAVHAFVPENVDAHVEAWKVKRWWEESSRPIGDGQYGNAAS